VTAAVGSDSHIAV